MNGERRSADLTLERGGASVRVMVEVQPYASPREALALLDELRSDLASLIAPAPPGSAA